ncbi:MAG: two-component system response regulator [Phycisphaerae bacterium]|nr:MAG: two-component system response regulator [Phycisphaerae bacterium]
MHLLLLESDRQQAMRIKILLQEEGHVVLTTSRGLDALEQIRSGQIRMVLVNQRSEDLDCIDFTRIARRMSLTDYLYIMILFDTFNQEQINSVLAAGADDYMTKPVNPVEISLRVKNAERIAAIDTRDEALIAMAKLAESRDRCTGRHVERVRLYARELAQAMWEMGIYFGQIDANFVDLIYRTAALHDLGKVAIPDAILSKSGKLTPHEYEIMKQHTRIGADTLASVMNQPSPCRFLRMGQEIALSHHERWDGRGYPNGLSGRDIPLSARIVAIADVYDALTSARSYKPAFSHSQAVQLIIDASDSQFDPMVVEAFAAVEETFDRIRQQQSDSSEDIVSHIRPAA